MIFLIKLRSNQVPDFIKFLSLYKINLYFTYIESESLFSSSDYFAYITDEPDAKITSEEKNRLITEQYKHQIKQTYELG